ncbi:hypothetical protein MOQ72_03835 [Saccharopolyspora sp. K220]|uniref:hypothetical protein n=1 Tax=Saccharopolyspora soli TaxID=2926618 RepID=UPI001F580FA8|nr:hypothetical protein [Saccharopolyspora soli]MCI2416543.1 hypothetical protein [Saccharopolyspora soli]
MTLSDHFAAPRQRTSSLDADAIEIHLPTQDRPDPAPTPDPDEFDESHLIRGYD